MFQEFGSETHSFPTLCTASNETLPSLATRSPYITMLGNVACILSLALLGLVSTKPVPATAAAGTFKTVYQFPSSSFTDIENVSVRSNGNLILSLITSPQVYTLDPTASNPSPSLVYTFPNATSALGIAQPSPDLFAVVVGDYSTATLSGIPGSFSIWTLDFNKSPPAVKKVAAIPEAHALNGMTTLIGSSTTVLVADSSLGAVFSVNVQTGAHKEVIQNSAFNPTSSFPLGLNGVRTSGNTLYFTNSAAGTFGSIPISSDGSAAGDAKTIATAPSGDTYDDFALDSRLDAIIATHQTSLLEVAVSGSESTVVNNAQLNNPTSVGTRSRKLVS